MGIQTPVQILSNGRTTTFSHQNNTQTLNHLVVSAIY